MIRIEVKLAASILVCFSASRQSRELPANAIIASKVRKNVRVRDIKNSVIIRETIEFKGHP